MNHLRTFDHLSIWEIAHRWHDVDPASTDPKQLPLSVQDTLRALTFAVSQDQFHVMSSTGTEYDNYYDVPNRYDYIRERMAEALAVAEGAGADIGVAGDEAQENEPDNVDVESLHTDFDRLLETRLRRHKEVVSKLYQCIDDGIFEKADFEQTHLGRKELLDYCLEEDLTPPSFWFTQKGIEQGMKVREEMKVREDEPERGRHADRDLDRELCRAIASTLWLLDPKLTIQAIIEHEAIQRFGNGRLYKGRDTIRSWIRDLDPRPGAKGGGRPRKKPAEE